MSDQPTGRHEHRAHTAESMSAVQTARPSQQAQGADFDLIGDLFVRLGTMNDAINRIDGVALDYKKDHKVIQDRLTSLQRQLEAVKTDMLASVSQLSATMGTRDRLHSESMASVQGYVQAEVTKLDAAVRILTGQVEQLPKLFEARLQPMNDRVDEARTLSQTTGRFYITDMEARLKEAKDAQQRERDTSLRKTEDRRKTVYQVVGALVIAALSAGATVAVKNCEARQAPVTQPKTP